MRHLPDGLRRLEAEAIFILREVAAAFRNPVLLYSIGKDSSVLLRLAQKAFFPSRIPFPFLHVDTTWKFKEMTAFRDRTAAELGLDLRVHVNQEGRARGISPVTSDQGIYTHVMKTEALRQALDAGKFDAAIGGARRDEEKSRAKERIFSHRTAAHVWDPRNQRPELWNLFNTQLGPGESMRVFPLSNWTEMDVWEYIKREKLDVPTIYFSHKRQCVRRNGQWLPVTGILPLKPKEEVKDLIVRVRTIGDIISTGLVESPANTVDDIIAEIAAARVTERGSRADDKASEAAMEDRKKQGYF
jgi:sulfate adenylyltransferase subunit 2